MSGDDEEGPHLPRSWVWTTMAEVCVKIQDGTHFSPKTQFRQGEYKYVTAKNIRPSGLDLADLTYLRKEDHQAIYQRCDPKRGDVLLVKDGVNTGDAANNTLDEEFSLLSSVCLLRPNTTALFGPYLRYYLLSPIGYRSLTGQMTGTAIKRIILRRVRTTPLPLAPLPEQIRIVAEIDKQFTRLDVAESGLNRTRANLKRYRASVLKAACEGRLVPTEAELARAEGRDYEPADHLLARIRQERCENWNPDQIAAKSEESEQVFKDRVRARYEEPREPRTEGLSSLPEGWAWASWEQLSRRVTVGHVGPMKHRYVERGIPFLRSQNVRENRFDSNGLLFIPNSFHQELKKSVLRAGDIIVVRSGSVGITCVVPDTIGEANCADLVIIQEPLGLLSKYGGYFMNSVAKSQIRAGSVGIALTHFNTKSVAKLPVAVPPLAEQERIVAEVERRLSLIDDLEVVVSANLKRAERLREAILKRAFEGMLVPQDPDDEPAGVLLERIRRERKTEPPLLPGL